MLNQELPQLLKLNGRLAVACIVRTWGSTPREVGATMLIFPDGTIQGTVGGGCGEAEVWQVASELLESESQDKIGHRIVHVDLTDDFDSDQGKVCGGRFDVLVEIWEQASPLDQELAVQIERAFQQEDEFALVRYLGPELAPAWKKSQTLFQDVAPLKLPERWVLKSLPKVDHNTKETLEAISSRLAALLSNDEVAYFVDHGPDGPHAFFASRYNVRRELIIAGAGHIARPLCTMATLTGYQVTIVDDRPEYAVAKSFPEARRVICAPFIEFFRELNVNENTSIVLVTRGHKHDQDSLWELREKPAAYIGMIGSRRRVKAVFADFHDKCEPAWLNSIKAPIGLNIGAKTPAEIAICILAEMIAVKTNKEKIG